MLLQDLTFDPVTALAIGEPLVVPKALAIGEPLVVPKALAIGEPLVVPKALAIGEPLVIKYNILIENKFNNFQKGYYNILDLYQ